MIEHRSASLEVRGRVISGLALPWGERARIGDGLVETFVRDAFADLRPVPLRLEHRGPTIGEITPESTERGLEVRGEYGGDLDGRDRFSIEFRARRDTRSENLRIVHAATLEGVAAVMMPAYAGAAIEMRRRLGPSMSTRIKTGKPLDCRCGFKAGTREVSRIEFHEAAFEGLLDEIKGGRNIAAIGRGAADVIADTNTGSLGLTMARGSLAVTVSPLDTEAGRRVTELVDNDVEVFARPTIDFEASEYEVEGGVARITAADFGFVLVKPTDRTEGLDPLKPRPEGRDRRRRIWL